MIGGSGGDDYYVNTAGDKVVEAANGGSDLVYADINYTLAANVERLVLQNAVNGAGNGLATSSSATALPTRSPASAATIRSIVARPPTRSTAASAAIT